MGLGLLKPLNHLAPLLLGLLSMSACFADEPPDDEGLYVGAFGGLGAVQSTSLQQKGAVFLQPPDPSPKLPINAQGSTGSSTDVAVGGLQLGYEWNGWNVGSNWKLRPAVELEGIYIGKHSPVGEMPVRPTALGTQYVTVPTTAGVFLANAVFTLRTPYSDKIEPYAGIGAGVALVSIRGSDSANPSEPGINHFNSDSNASDTAFAMQAKVGLKGRIGKHLSLFAEYRYLSIDATSYTFGSTDYPGVHLPTTSWHVDMGRQQYNLFVAGLQYKF